MAFPRMRAKTTMPMRIEKSQHFLCLLFGKCVQSMAYFETLCSSRPMLEESLLISNDVSHLAKAWDALENFLPRKKR